MASKECTFESGRVEISIHTSDDLVEISIDDAMVSLDADEIRKLISVLNFFANLADWAQR